MFEDVNMAPAKQRSKKYRDKIKEDREKYQQYLEREKERYKKGKETGKLKAISQFQSGNKDAGDESGKLTKETKGLVIRTERRYKVI